VIVFAFAFLVQASIHLRDQFLIKFDLEDPELAITYSIGISISVGYMVIGNIYDNVRNPKLMSVILFAILAFFSLIVRSLH